MPEGGVQVAISAVDLTSPPFMAATARAEAFSAGMEKTTYSMREAQGAARLFNEELGLGMSRHLTSVLAQSALLGPALEGAFAIAAAVGFYEVIEKIAKKLSDIYNDTEGSKRFGERMKATTDSIRKNYSEATKETAEAGEVGASSQQKWSQALDLATKNVTKQKREVEDLTNKVFALKNDLPMTPKVGTYTDTSENVVDVMRKQAAAQADLAKATADQAKAQAELTVAQRAGMDEYLKKMDEAEKKSQALQHEINKWAMMWDKARGKALDALLPAPAQGMFDKAQIPGGTATPDWMSGLSNSQMPLYAGTRAAMNLTTIQNDQNAAIQKAQDIYEQTASKAQKYADVQQELGELLLKGKIDVTQFESAMGQAAAGLDAHRKEWEQLGSVIGKNLESAIMFQTTWSKAFKSILADVVKLILQMEVFQRLSDDFGGGGAGGSFLGQLFAGMGGLSGKAGGGPVSGGMSYLVGERGPELFTPGSSGAITSAGKFGGSTVNNYIDARGADASVEMRVRRAIAESENRAVSRAVAVSADLQARR